MAEYQSRGLYFEDLEAANGLELVSAGRTISESDIMLFAGLSGDWNPMHVDAEYAKMHPFGERVAHGLLIMAIASGLAAQLGFMDRTVEAFRQVDNWKMRLPVKIGDTVHITAKVVSTRAVRRTGGLVIFAVSVLNQEDKVVQEGKWIMFVRNKLKVIREGSVAN